MNSHDETITIDMYEEEWKRDITRVVDDDGTIKEIIPDTTVYYLFRVLGSIPDVRKFQEILAEFIFNHPNIKMPQNKQDDN